MPPNNICPRCATSCEEEEDDDGADDEENPDPPNEEQTAGDPVILSTGEYIYQSYDVRAGKPGEELAVIRRYGNQSSYNSGFGYGWDSSLFARATEDATTAQVRIKGGMPIPFARSGDTYTGKAGFTLVKSGDEFIYAEPNGVTYHFSVSGTNVLSKTLRTGVGYKWLYDGTDKLTAVTDEADASVFPFRIPGHHAIYSCRWLPRQVASGDHECATRMLTEAL